MALVDSGRSTSIEGIFKDRVERTVKLSLNPECWPYSRVEVLDELLRAGVPRECDRGDRSHRAQRRLRGEVGVESKTAHE